MPIEQTLSPVRYLNIEQIKQQTGYSISTLRRAIKGGEICVSRRGLRGHIRVTESEVLRWMRDHEIPAGPV